MRKLSLVLPLFALAFTACQKEMQEDETVRYSDYYVRSPKDSSKWIKIEEYNKLYPPSKVGDDKSLEDCFYETRDNNWKKGKSCSNTRHSGCDEPHGCFSKN